MSTISFSGAPAASAYKPQLKSKEEMPVSQKKVQFSGHDTVQFSGKNNNQKSHWLRNLAILATLPVFALAAPVPHKNTDITKKDDNGSHKGGDVLESTIVVPIAHEDPKKRNNGKKVGACVGAPQSGSPGQGAANANSNSAC
jgi:hypothetical protein